MTVSRTLQQGGVAIPTFFYGTAWREERTAALTRLAVERGFTAVGAANQREHDHAAAVGAAVRAGPRLFLQSKFTPRDSQDDRLPYDPPAEVEVQVQQSPVRADADVAALARDRGTSVTRAVFRFCLERGMIALTGTSQRAHMLDDLAAYADPPLGLAVVARLEGRLER